MDDLFDLAPKLYREFPCIECGPGWEDILVELSTELEGMISALPEDEQECCYAMQVKEKFGTLRFYMSSETDEMEEAIKRATAKSRITCESCGKPGSIRGKKWYYVACDEHTHESDL